MNIIKAEQQDLQEILDLQYLAYQSEARLFSNPNIPPLTQTLQQLQQEYENGIILKAVDADNVIVGSVRAYFQNDTLQIGKLMVRPDLQGQGLGTRLLSELECKYPSQRYELFTSSKSERNIKLYKRLGYVIFKHEDISAGLTFVYLRKEA